MIDSGRLDTKIEILQPVVTIDAYGTQQTSWSIFCATWCGVLRKAGRRALVEGAIADITQRDIILRYRKGITTHMRVRFIDEDTVYVIQNSDPRRSEGEIRLTLSIVADGRD